MKNFIFIALIFVVMACRPAADVNNSADVMGAQSSPEVSKCRQQMGKSKEAKVFQRLCIEWTYLAAEWSESEHRTYVMPDTVEKSQLATQARGLGAVLSCLANGLTLSELESKLQDVKSQLSALSKTCNGTPFVSNDTANLAYLNAEKLYADRKTFSSDMYNPVFAALIENSSATDQQIATDVLEDISRRKAGQGKLGWAQIGFSRLKHYYASLLPGLNGMLYSIESTMTDAMRADFKLVQNCLSQHTRTLTRLYSDTNKTTYNGSGDWKWDNCAKSESEFMRIGIALRENPFLYAIVIDSNKSEDKKIAAINEIGKIIVSNENARTRIRNTNLQDFNSAAADNFFKAERLHQTFLLNSAMSKKLNDDRWWEGVAGGISHCGMTLVVGGAAIQGMMTAAKFAGPEATLAVVAVGTVIASYSIGSDVVDLTTKWEKLSTQDATEKICVVGSAALFAGMGIEGFLKARNVKVEPIARNVKAEPINGGKTAVVPSKLVIFDGSENGSLNFFKTVFKGFTKWTMAERKYPLENGKTATQLLMRPEKMSSNIEAITVTVTKDWVTLDVTPVKGTSKMTSIENALRGLSQELASNGNEARFSRRDTKFEVNIKGQPSSSGATDKFNRVLELLLGF